MWKVDDGTLRIKPYKESDDPDLGFYLRSRPWAAYNDQITAISIEGECNFKESISSAFGGMPALKTVDLSGLSLLQIQDMAGCSLDAANLSPLRSITIANPASEAMNPCFATARR